MSETMLERAYNLCDAAAKIIVMAAPSELASEDSNNPLSQYIARWTKFQADYKATLAPTPPSEKERERLGDDAVAQIRRMLEVWDGEIDRINICMTAAEWRDVLRQADAPVGWVSVDERLPPFKTLVLVLDHDIGGAPAINLGRLENAPPPYKPSWHLRQEPWERGDGPKYQRVTHWMPLPAKEPK